MKSMKIHGTIVLLAAVLTAGCDDSSARSAAEAEPAPEAASAAADRPAGAVVDSSFPPAEQMRRFRASIVEPAPVGWSGGAESRDALIQGFIEAVAAADSAALEDMAMSRAEFAYLYYEDSPLSRAPTRLDPAIGWFLIEQNSTKGLTRVLRRFGGRSIRLRDYECPEPPQAQGTARVWERCVIRHTAEGGDVPQSWFGGIIESGGRFKFVSYANGF